MTRGATSVLTALLMVPLLTAAPTRAEAAPAWKKLHDKHAAARRPALLAQLKRDGVPRPERLLKHPYLVRLEIRGAGGGSALHSEVVVRFRSRPALVLAKAWARGGNQPGRAQLGAWAKCKTRQNAVGRTCPVKYNGKGFQDVTSAFTDRNVLFVHDPKKKGTGASVVWFAAARSQQYMWFYVVPHTAWPSFGKPRVRVKKFLAPKEQPPARLPGAPPDPGSPRVRPRPQPDPPAAPPAKRPVVAPRPRPVSQWTTLSDLHRATTKAALRRLMRADGFKNPDYLLSHRFLLRVSLTKAGGGSRSRSELLLRLASKPQKALGKAWADRTDMRRAQIGADSRCRPLPADQGGPEGRRCPMHFNGLGWRNLITAFTDKDMRVVVDPNNNNQGNVLLWLAFDQSQSGLQHRFVLRPSLPSFGKGTLDVGFYAVSEDGQVQPTPRPPATPGAGWTAVGASTHRSWSRAALARRMRRDGVASPAYLLRHKYLVRFSVTGAGGGQGQRSEVVVRMTDQPKAALGTAWGDHRRRWGAQIGSLAQCKLVPRARNPYGGEQDLKWHACPMQYNGLGWRNLIGAFKGPKVMLVTAPHRKGGGNQLLWLAFDRPQSFHYKPAVDDQAHRDSLGRVYAEKIVVGAPGATTPSPGVSGATWRRLSGSHGYVHKNQLYWKIKRDGFTNPWYVLRHRYLVRATITAVGTTSHAVLRFPGAPAIAVGKGVAAQSNRSAVQAGTLAKCQATAGAQPRCPLHYANLGWRNLITGLKGTDLLFVNIPLDPQSSATTHLWLGFDNPQSVVQLRYLRTAGGKASVQLQRYRW